MPDRSGPQHPKHDPRACQLRASRKLARHLAARPFPVQQAAAQ